VNYTFDTAERTWQWIVYHPGPPSADDVMCLAYEVATGEPCPSA
jgi:hypothetical protein